MILRYGTYSHQDNECGVSIERIPSINAGGEQYAYHEIWNISGFLQGADVPTVTTLIANMQNAYAIQGQAIGIFLSDGVTQTAHGTTVASTLGGVRITRGPTFSNWAGAEYSTYRSYSITAEFTVPVQPFAQVAWLSFFETLSFKGGGSKWGFLPVLVGLPQLQQLNEVLPQTIVQRGQIIGYKNYPPLPGPIWPEWEHRDLREITPKNPERAGPPGNPSYYSFQMDYAYYMESPVPLVGIPNRWPAI